MSKATPQAVLDLGFTGAQFGIASASGAVTFVQAVLDEVAPEVESQVGASAYNDAANPTKQRVINAEKYLAASLLMDRLVAIIFRSQGSTQEGRPSAWAELKQRDEYREKGAYNIALINGALSESFSSTAYEPEAVS